MVDFVFCLLYYDTMRLGTVIYDRGKPKKSSQSANKSRVKLSSMNKHKKRSYKAYNGQGR